MAGVFTLVNVLSHPPDHAPILTQTGLAELDGLLDGL